jgi:hypothetical protein
MIELAIWAMTAIASLTGMSNIEREEYIFETLYEIESEAAIDYVLDESMVPEEYHYDYKVVMICESQLDPESIGDGGSAIGLLQIHHDPWVEWATQYGKFDLTRPIDNINMAWLIQEEYDIVRHRDRWNQWTVKPSFTSCQQRLREL